MHATSSFRKRLTFGRSKEKQSRGKSKKKDVVVVTSSSSTSTGASSPPLDASKPSEATATRNGSRVTRSANLPAQHLKQQQHSAASYRTPPKQHFCSKDIIAAAAALDNEGNLLLEMGDYNSARKSYERALELKRQSLYGRNNNCDNEELLASVATSINNIGYLRQRSGAPPKESMAAYQDSLRIKREILGRKSLSVGKTLNNIGSVYYSLKQFPQALQSYQQAKDIMEHNLGSQHLDIATVFSNIGDVYMAQARRQEAHDQYKEALTIRWMHLDEHSPKVMRLLEKIALIEMNQEILESYDEESDDEERVFTEEIPVEAELHALHTEVEEDIKQVTDLRRKMALDMVKDKLRILKGMRHIDNDSLLENESDEEEQVKTPLHLSPTQREDALSSVKERLARLRENRAMGESPVINHGNDGEQEDTGSEELEEFGLEHLTLLKLNLESVIGS